MTIWMKKLENESRPYLEFDIPLEDVFIKALRYDYGRHSATTGDVALELIPLVPDLSLRSLECIARDIAEFKERRDLMIKANDGKPLGVEVYEHDVKPNLDLEEAIIKELKVRHKE